MLCFGAKAQRFTKNLTNVDSLLRIANLRDDTVSLNARIKLFWEFDLKNPSQAKAHLDTASRMSSLKNYSSGRAELNKCYGSYYSSVGQLDLAQKHLKKSIDYYKQIKEKNGPVFCYNQLGIIEGQKGNLDKALEYFLLVKKRQRELGNEEGIAKVNINIGLVHYMLNDFEKAEYYYQNAHRYLKKKNDLYGMMHVFSKRATNSLELKDYDNALKFMNSSLELAIELEDSIQQVAIEQNLGSYFSGIGKHDSALVHYHNYKDLSEKMGLKQNLSVAQMYIGKGEFDLGNLDKALRATEDAVRLAKEMGDQLRVMNAYDLLTKIHESKGQHKLALDIFRKFKQLSDSLQGVDVKSKINELKIVYDVAEKENKNKVLKEQNKHKQLKVKQLYTVILTIVLLFISLVIVVVLVLRQKKIKSRLEQTELEQKALRAQMNPHFIFNALNSIQRMYIEGNEDKANEYMADFSRLLRTILENSGRRFIKLREELEITKLYLDLEKLRTDHLFDYKITVEEGLDDERILFPPLILQPYVENAIWHGIIPSKKQGLIEINVFRSHQNQISIEIIDNGIGINASKSLKKEPLNRSLGMQITSQRLGGNEYVKTEELQSGGTKISLTLKHDK